MSDKLNQNEIDSLLSSLPGESEPEASSSDIESPGPVIKLYDFRRPDKFSMVQIRSLAVIHRMFANKLQSLLSMECHFPVGVSLASVDQLTCEEALRSFPNPTCLSLFSHKEYSGKYLIEYDSVLSSLFIAGMCGASSSILSSMDKKITSGLLDNSLYGYLSGKMASELDKTWTPLHKNTSVYLRTETDSSQVYELPPWEMAAIITLECRSEFGEGLINILYPFLYLEPFVSCLCPEAFYGYSPFKKGVVVKDESLDKLLFSVDISIPLSPLDEKALLNLKPGMSFELGAIPDLRLSQNGKTIVPFSFNQDSGDFSAFLTRAVERDKTEMEKSSPSPSLNSSKTDSQGSSFGKNKPFDYLEDSSILPGLLPLLENESLQTQALILSYLSPSDAAVLLERMSEEQRLLVLNIAGLKPVKSSLLQVLSEALKLALVGSDIPFTPPGGGAKAAAGILNSCSLELSQSLLKKMEKADPECTGEILENMFLFEDLLLLSDRDIQRLLRDIDSNELVTALQGASEELKQTIFRNMSERASNILKEDLEYKRAASQKNVEEARRGIINVLRILESRGSIVIDVQEKK